MNDVSTHLEVTFAKLPCKRRIMVCFEASRIYARCAFGLRTAEIAFSPVKTVRMLLRREFCSTKKKPNHVRY